MYDKLYCVSCYNTTSTCVTQEQSKSAIVADHVDINCLSSRGTFAEIEYMTNMDGGLQLGVVGHRRIKILQEIPQSLPSQANFAA